MNSWNLLEPNHPLACCDAEQLNYPFYFSEKVDGIRGVFLGGKVRSKTMKLLPNVRLQEYFSPLLTWLECNNFVLDGEIIGNTFQETVSVCMSKDKEIPDHFKVLGMAILTRNQWDRETPWIFEKHNRQHLTPPTHCKFEMIHQIKINTKQIFDLFHDIAKEKSWEGYVIRYPNSMYKHGRAGKYDGFYKFKFMKEYSGKIIGVNPLEINSSSALRTKDVFNRLETIHTKDDKVKVPTMGSLLVKLTDGVTCKIGTWRGLTEEERISLWQKREELIGTPIDFLGQAVGIKDKPRIPHEVRIRWEEK